MQDGIVVRKLEAGDSISALTELLHRAYRPLADNGLRFLATHQDDSVTLDRCREGECYVAMQQGKIVGTILFRDSAATEGCDWYDRPDVASFGQFAVSPELQGRGIGSMLIDLVESLAAETGAQEIALDTAEGAKHLIEYYTRRGYRPVGHADWEETNYISVILSKRLQTPAKPLTSTEQ
jgi:GNAT superfamily N-acetyltransferase